jgi:hypothetical protein
MISLLCSPIPFNMRYGYFLELILSVEMYAFGVIKKLVAL